MRGETSNEARQLADDHGVSERTAWRWMARMYAEGTMELLEHDRVCRYCRLELPAEATIRREYCDDTCRQYARRRRLARAAIRAARS